MPAAAPVLAPPQHSSLEMDVVEHRDAAFGRNAVAGGKAPQLTTRVIDMGVHFARRSVAPCHEGRRQAVLAGHPGRTKTLCEQITARWPILCGVSAYAGSGFPSPTTRCHAGWPATG